MICLWTHSRWPSRAAGPAASTPTWSCWCSASPTGRATSSRSPTHSAAGTCWGSPRSCTPWSSSPTRSLTSTRPGTRSRPRSGPPPAPSSGSSSPVTRRRSTRPCGRGRRRDGAALALVKAGSRLAINSSPEPVTNVVASLTEDVAVLGAGLVRHRAPAGRRRHRRRAARRRAGRALLGGQAHPPRLAALEGQRREPVPAPPVTASRMTDLVDHDIRDEVTAGSASCAPAGR